ncbi:MAG TPA: restriction endonuclease subunit S [Longimicrobiales bacterium]|nr:restriction endonuclease subunit S [Longimicrobiales bacterium]
MQTTDESRRLDELVQVVSQQVGYGDKKSDLPYIGLEHIPEGGGKILGVASSTVSASTNFVFRPGDILFGKLRPYLRKSVQVDFEGYCSTDIIVLRTSGEADQRYAAWMLQSDAVFHIANQTAIGTRMPRTSWSSIRDIIVHAPSIPEQRRIAEILDTVDEAIQQTEAVIAKLKEMKQGLLHDLLTRGLDENGELRDPVAHPELFKDSPLGRIPREWEVRQLGSLCYLLNGLAFKPEEWAESGLPIIRIQNLNGGVDFNYFAGRVRREYIIPPGTLLFSWSGSRGTSFGPFIWLGPVGVLNQHIFRVTPLDGVRQGWFYYALDDVRRRVERHAHGGSGLVHVRRGDLEKYLIATPPESEQKRIESMLSVYDERIRSEEKFRDKLNLSKGGLMQDLLTGCVRVPVPSTHPETVEATA